MLGPLAARRVLGPLGYSPVEGITGPLAVAWTAIVNCTVVAPNTLTKNGGGAAFDAGAVSTMAIPSGDGYFAMTYDVSRYRIAGMSYGANAGAGLAEIEFGFNLAAAGVYVIESGTNKFGPFAALAGDTLSVNIESGAVIYRKNGALVYTSLLAPSYPIYVDCSISQIGYSVVGATIYSAAGLSPSGY